MGIYFQEVSFTYFPKRKKENNDYTIKDINLKIDQKENEFIVIVGKTGSGKSTLVSLMNALILPTTGVIDIMGSKITSKKQDKLKEVRKKVGLVFQFPEYQLFEETVLKDVMFGPKNFKLDNVEERAKKALGLFGITEYNKNPYRLSGGEMRKVAISGIMASDPDILILDEPTVGLDPKTKEELTKLLIDINNQGKKIIMITHDMDLLWDVSTRVIVVYENKIVFDGSKYDLFKENETIIKYGLDLPEVIKIAKAINNNLNLEISEYNKDIYELFDNLVNYEQ